MSKIPKKSASATKTSTVLKPSSTPVAAPAENAISVSVQVGPEEPAEQTAQPGGWWRKDAMM